MRKPFSLEGRVALITGVGPDLGTGIALALAEAGAAVALAARGKTVPDALAQMITGDNGNACALECDVTDPGQVQSSVAAVLATFGRLDIVVQVASSTGSHAQPLETIRLEEWDAQTQVTTRAAFNLARSCHAALRANGSGRMIFVTSAYGLSGDGGNPIYSACKGGLRGFVKSLAKEWGEDGITVNAIAPSSTSANTEAYFLSNPDAWDVFRKAIPMRRMGDPRTDIGPAVAAMASDAFRFVSGQTIPIDGGLYTSL